MPSAVTLRPYQWEAITALLADLNKGEHPICNAATGTGKSLLIAELCRQLSGRILVATHRKELLAQNNAQLSRLLGEEIGGIYSAGIGRRDADARVIFGGIQSIYRKMAVLQEAGPFRYVICDECHLCPDWSDEKPSMYQQVFTACEDAQRIGLSATPYRLDGGALYGRPGTWFTTMPVTIGARELTDLGFLAPLHGLQAATDLDLSAVRRRNGDYVLSDLSQVMTDDDRVSRAVDEIAILAAERRSWLCFCCDVAHTTMVTNEMQKRGILARMVIGSTPNEERDALLADFRAGQFQCLVNCQVATTGFDIPQIDCVILMRPTQSKGLLVQMLGRGMRCAQGKRDALVLDYADTIGKHLPLEEIPTMAKTRAVIEQEAKRDEEKRVQEEKEHARHMASLAEAAHRKAVTYRVEAMAFKVTPSSQQRGRNNLMITYLCPERKPSKWVSIWLCPEYVGYARQQAEAWFQRRSQACPVTAHRAMALAQRCTHPESIVIDETKKFPRLVMEHMSETASREEEDWLFR